MNRRATLHRPVSGLTKSSPDAVLKKPAAADEVERMIRSLVGMRAIGPELATLLVREAFSRPISNRRALGSYAGPSCQICSWVKSSR
jgi:hypothetical protein